MGRLTLFGQDARDDHNDKPKECFYEIIEDKDDDKCRCCGHWIECVCIEPGRFYVESFGIIDPNGKLVEGDDVPYTDDDEVDLRDDFADDDEESFADEEEDSADDDEESFAEDEKDENDENDEETRTKKTKRTILPTIRRMKTTLPFTFFEN